jgi:8-oxo-dGTP diphosphatase
MEKKKPGIGFGIMVLNENNEVLLGKRHEDAEKADSELHGEGTWTMPGGKLHFQEKLKDAAYRETLEETGIKIDKNKLKIISVTDDIVYDNHFVTIGFLCKDFQGKPEVMEPDEITEWNWFDIDNLPSPMYFPSEKVIKNYKENKFYIK